MANGGLVSSSGATPPSRQWRWTEVALYSLNETLADLLSPFLISHTPDFLSELMTSRRIYCARHVVRAAGDGAPQWLVGWSSSSASPAAAAHSFNSSSGDAETQQVCVGAAVDQSLISERALNGLLRSLNTAVPLQALWRHVGGVPILLGVASGGGSARERPTAAAVAAELQLECPSPSSLPIVISGAHGVARSEEVILFDAPALASGLFFASANPFGNGNGSNSVHVRTLRDEDDGNDGDDIDVDESSDAEPLTLSGDHRASFSLSPLETALRQANAASAVQALLNHFVAHAESAELPELLRSVQLEDLLRRRSVCPRSLKNVLGEPFVALSNWFSWLFFFLCARVLRPLLQLRVLSLSSVTASLFTPSIERRVRLETVPLWRASFALGALHSKVQLALQARKLHRALAKQRTSLLATPTAASLRADEQLWGDLVCHGIDMRLGLLAGLALLALMGTFDGNHPTLQAWLPSWLLDSATLRASLFVCPAPLLASFHGLRGVFDALLSSAAPAGLKLNERLHMQLARLLRQGAAEYTALGQALLASLSASALSIALARGALVLLSLSTMVLGISFFLAVAQDALWIASLPLVVLHATLSRATAFTGLVFSVLWRLFRGEKRNVLRGGRIDQLLFTSSTADHAAAAASGSDASLPSSSFKPSAASSSGGNFELVLLGTVALVATTFLAPTVLVWHALATTLRLLGCEIPLALLALMRIVLRCLPMRLLSLWARDRIDDMRSGRGGRGEGNGGRRIPAGIWMEVLPSPQDDAGVLSRRSTLYLQLHASRAPAASTLAFRASSALCDAMATNPLKRVLRRMLWGSSG
jgi:hypothetical protein